MGRVQARDRWIVEHLGEPIGMIVRDEAGFVFHAAAKEVWSLDQSRSISGVYGAVCRE